MDSLNSFLHHHAAFTPDADAVTALGRAPLNYRQLGDRVVEVTALLRSAGIGETDVVALVLPDGPDTAVFVLGVCASAAAAPLNAVYSVGEYVQLFQSLRPTRLIVAAGHGASAVDAARAGGIAVLEVAFDSAGPIGACQIGRIETPSNVGPALADPDAIALMLFTSGTAARPRLVPLSHAQLVAAARNITAVLELTAADRCLGTMPLFHIHGLSLLFASIASGGCYAGLAGFSPAGFYDALPVLRPTWYSASPAIHRIVLDHLHLVPNRLQQSSLRLIRSASAPMPPTWIAELEQAFGVPFVEAYGMTEAGPQIASNRVPPAARKLGSVGRAAGCEVAIIDDHGRPLAPGVVGEIAIRGPSVTRGYQDNPEANRAAFVSGWLRTGDLGYLDEDQFLFVSGRSKEVINRGGEKISPRKIDDVLAAHPNVAQAATFAVPHVVLGEDVAAAVVVKVPPEDSIAFQSSLRSFVAERLAPFEVPHQFVLVDRIPLGPSGKLIRGQLAAELGLLGHKNQATTEPARTPTERRIAQVLAEVLRTNEPGLHDDFFALGGHSLAAMQVSTRLGQIFHFPVPMDVLFNRPTVAELAAFIGQQLADVVAGGTVRLDALAAGATDAHDRPVRRSTTTPAPLSLPQQRVYFLDQIGSGNAYHMSAGLRLSGPLDAASLRRAVRTIVNRHEALRTTFKMLGDQPAQFVEEPDTFDVPLVDLSALSPQQADAALEELAAAAPFDLAKGPLFRATLVRIAHQEHRLLFGLHHIVTDGWSIGLLHDELRRLYAAFAADVEPKLPPLEFQYSDFAAWQQTQSGSAAMARDTAYWAEQLRGAPPGCTFPTDRPRPALHGHNGATHRTHIGRPIVERMTAIARAERATPFMVFLAAFQTLLFRCNGQEDCIVGTPFAGRSRKEWEPLIGFFASTLALRTSMAADPLFSDLLARVRATALGAFAHQEVPLEKLVDELRLPRDPSRTPLFQVMFAFQNLPDAGDRPLHFAPGLTARRVERDSESAKFDLTLYLTESDGGLAARWQYNTDLYDASTVERFARQFDHLLAAIASDYHRPISTLPMVDDAELRRITIDWNATAVTRVQRHNVLHLIDGHVRQTPNAVAVVSENSVWTYAQLNDRANAIGRHLVERGVAPGQLVGICLTRSAEHVAALLGIWRAGAAFLPIDPTYPAQRVGFMYDDSGCAALLTESERLARWQADPAFAASVKGIPIEAIDAADLCKGPPAVEPPVAEALAYVIYTSGSTGRPKGVMITHGNVCHYAQAMVEALGILPTDRYLHTAPFGFSSSVRQFVVPLASGAAIVIAPADAARDPAALFELAKAQRASVIDLVPSMWSAAAQVISEFTRTERDGLLGGSLRLALSASEPLPVTVAAAWRRMFPSHVRQINMFGQTETTGIVSTYLLPADGEAVAGIVPVGRPIANTQLYVLDAARQAVPVGVAGELYVGGDGVGRGYRNQPELTDRHFGVDPFAADGLARLYRTGDLARYRDDGVLEFLGRSDGQVKVRGYRIEPAEIESVAVTLDGVRECAVLPVHSAGKVDGVGGTRLVAFVTPADVNAAKLRAALKGRLPDYMVPQAIHALGQFPRTISGKVDRTALLATLAADQPAIVDAVPATREVPQSEAEQILADVWKQVLRLERVGPDENFFDLGGNSLLSIPVINRANQAGLKVTLSQLYQNQTIADLARVAGSPAASPSSKSHVAAQASLSAPPDEVPVLVTVESLRAYGREALIKAGLTADGAAIVTEVQLEASLRGQPTHNMVSIPRYAKRLSTGKLNNRPDIRVEHETATSARLDGDNGPGQWVATVAMNLAIRKAQESGVGMVSVRRSNHFGAAAQYALPAAQAGLIGLCTTNGPLILAPTGGVRATFGNNPIGVGILSGKHFPILLDIAMSVAPRGRIGLAVAEGRPLSPGWILDARGRPTTDLADLAAGLGVPIGGHKGYGLALVMEVLAGALGGAGFCADHHRDALALKPDAPDYGHFFMVIDPALFGPADAFTARVDRIIEQTKAGPLADGADEILIPGEPELRARARSLKEGVRLRPSTYAALLSYAKDACLATRLDVIQGPPVGK